MEPEELEQCRTLLGVAAGASLDDIERAFMRKNFSLIKGRTGAADEAPPPDLALQKQQVRAAYEKLVAHARAQAASGGGMHPPRADRGGDTPVPGSPPVVKTLLTPPVVTPRDPADDEFILFRFDDWKVNTFVPPLLILLVGLVHLTPLKMLLTGFHVWMHEFGHSTAAWLCGWRATPLPIGWTPVEQVHSNFVYGGVLLLFGLLFAAGWKERKVWPMLAAVALSGLQFYMTWKLPEKQKEFWMVFGGIGGEFYLSTLLMMSFWVQLPEKFKWGMCRYVFFLIGATALLNIWLHWRDVYRGIEEIPFGTLIQGEEDAGGDMNRLMDDYGWKKFTIRRTYYVLGWSCWIALGAMWLLFALRLNRVADWVVGKFGAGKAETV
ncbi:hypothetical protein ESB00_02765 [Oleiharenicola lentus]|uniref:Uncharacterized protein n=1 Tax=Oleiharenicola lentus TaxID=2508720 RepID=A0A4Q1C7D9_9BACT|nr:hypothetical protein [Oleiharenicola lentus]RXK54837.1 hypothetical protein ESB00_02765 [Oleiharenicola lentus]